MNIFILTVLMVAELVMLGLILVFFQRLKKSEQTLSSLQANHDDLLDRMQESALLEQEMVATFTLRQEQLAGLNSSLDNRIALLRKLLDQAEGISRSPRFLREVILNSRKKGQSIEQISRSTGLARDEIELILAKADMGKPAQ